MRKKDNRPLPEIMSEEELQQELKGSLIILSTSSPDKRTKYRTMFSSFDLDGEKKLGGIDAFFTDSGALGVVPRKTPEQTDTYEGNRDEKAFLLLSTLRDETTEQMIRLKLSSTEKDSKNEFDSQKVNLIGMSEDSGWHILFKDDVQDKGLGKEEKKKAEKAREQKFIDSVVEQVTPLIRERDQWLIRKMLERDGNGETNGAIEFPGPNLKPLQEHLGGFDALMEIIYTAAEKAGMNHIPFENVSTVSFVSPKLNKTYSRDFVSGGHLISREEYNHRVLSIQKGGAINSDFVQVPAGQAGEPKTLDLLLQDMLTRPSSEIPADYNRRAVTEWIQELIGARRSTRAERDRTVHLGTVSPERIIHKHAVRAHRPIINDIKDVPTYSDLDLMPDPELRHSRNADVIMLIPSATPQADDFILRPDANYELLLRFVLNAETESHAMRVPIIVDNRSKSFDGALALMRDAFAQGRLIGDAPFWIANNDAELEEMLTTVKDIIQRQPRILDVHTAETDLPKAPLTKVPDDGIFTLFIGGGHNNNSKRDMEDAHDFGYYCASQGWRIITGAGSIEGSMGAVHTGFIQCHLDKAVEERKIPKEIGKQIKRFMHHDKYDAEAMILEAPELVDALADKGVIPRDMFYGYSMIDLLKMESPNNRRPPGITYSESGNRIRRLDALLDTGFKVALHGSIGTDEEIEATIRQHVTHAQEADPKDRYADGALHNGGGLVIYNASSKYDQLLQHHYILGEGKGSVSKKIRSANNIAVVNSLEDLKAYTQQQADKWEKRIAEEQEAAGKTKKER